MRTPCKKFPRNVLATAVALSLAPSVWAYDFETEGGWKGSLNTTLSVASGWRAQAADKSLIGAPDAAIALGYARTAGLNGANAAATGHTGGTKLAREAGYLGAANSDAGNLNYDKGDQYATPFKIIADLNLSKGDAGFKIGVKAWHDYTQKNGDVPFGNQANGFNGATSTPSPMPAGSAATLTTPGASRPLSDAGFPALNKFTGLELREAYVYDKFTVGGQSLNVKLGNQIVKWGNSLMLQGLSQTSPIDATALRKPGTEAEEGLLPIWSVAGKLGLSNGMSVDGFYQLKARSSSIESCGTYFGASDFGLGSVGDFCAIAQVAGSPTGGWAGGSTDGRPDVMLVQGKEAKNGDWGLSFTVPVKDVGNFGFYAMNLGSRTPFISGQVQAPATPGAAAGATQGARMRAQWDYVNDISVYGVTFLTKLDTWRAGAELSHTPKQPVQINGFSLIQAGLAYSTLGPVAGANTLNSLGPLGQRMIALGATPGAWNYIQGYDSFSKTQLLINGATPVSKAIAGALGASGGVFAAELGYQRSGVTEVNVAATGVPSTVLYGRAFIFGLPVSAANCAPTGVSGTNPQPQGCLADGFYTQSSWGYRMRFALDYTNAFGTDWKVTPSIYLAHDVDGYSVDGQFVEGRKTLNLSLALNLHKKHDLVFGYTTYANNAKYDVFRDRDNYTMTYRYKF